ncbi:histidine kinase sensor domain-containing protein [Oceanospirillum sp.]|uniref:histidine kinase sensor domain-containing protein n=1 Tax=Oceanospirillum sp. TaxID=2021254 RepID=UPI003A912704
MSRRLYVLLVLGICLGTLLLFAAMHKAEDLISRHLTRIKPEHQQVLSDYAWRASELYQAGNEEGMHQLIAEINEKHDTWAAVITPKLNAALGTHVPEEYLGGLSFQRKLDWPVHTVWREVLIGIPFKDHTASLVLRLPESMHPRPNLALWHIGLVWVLPLSVLFFFTRWLYRHLIRPINILKTAAKDLAFKEVVQPVRPQLGRRQDELAVLATSFDEMAERIQLLVSSQRQLIGDLSHELRTPLARMRLVQGSDWPDELKRAKIDKEIGLINQLIDDAMTLAWLDNEQRRNLPEHLQEEVKLDQLLDVICDDAEFEFASKLSGSVIKRRYAKDLLLTRSNTLALSQSLENIIRNGLIHSPEGCGLTVCVEPGPECFVVRVLDQGAGVPEAQLEKIFHPFFRLDKARARQRGGFGLGLAIARKQVSRLGGSLKAENYPGAGLMVSLVLPR